jgi:beta-glucosidase
MKLDIPYMLEHLTLEEKAGLCSGKDQWFTKAVERLGLPSIMVSDGPHGLRTQKEKVNGQYIGSIKSVCFPTGCALACSYDRDLMHHVGNDLGKEARAEGVQTLLGPAVNIKRSPLCGRNFEYLGEDPYQVGEMASSYVKGVQEEHVGVSLKHFAANSQEFRRMSIDEHIDERTLREIYLAAFEKVVKEAKPWTLMCSYNQINGAYSSENPWLLTKVLRDDWGFDGVVMSDWGAVNRRVPALRAGLELEMPSSGGVNDRKIVAAVKDGSLSMEVLDRAVRRLLEWIQKGVEDTSHAPYDKEADHEDARKASCACAVLLRNEHSLLPLPSFDGVLFVGPFAKKPRFQGGGSSHINNFKLTSAIDAAPGVTYLPGMGDDSETRDEKRLEEAVSASSSAKAVVVFAGLPETWESEGYDRATLSLPPCQDELIAKLVEKNKNIIVVLHHGSSVTMPWRNDVASILDMYLGGQAVGGATVDLLLGKVNPSGKLAETSPLRLEDTPCYLDYDKGQHDAYYGERVFVGYRWYDERKLPVQYPFGFGLSYTTFSLSSLSVSSKVFKEGDLLVVTLKVKNTGKKTGSEVVQLYVAPPKGLSVARPPKELKGFCKVFLQPGEEKEVTMTLDGRSFSYWDNGWRAEKGVYAIAVGPSSQELTLTASVTVEEKPRKLTITDATTIGDVLGSGYPYPAFEQFFKQMMRQMSATDGTLGSGEKAMREAMMMSLPLHAVCSFTNLDLDVLLKMLS